VLSGVIRGGDGRGGVGVAELRKQLRDAAKDKQVKAVVLRIDSGGGDAVASEAIWREVQQVRSAGKPVVASMGNVAASGAYMVAVAADRIVAQPGTYTGSIGVLTVVPEISRWLKKNRVNCLQLSTPGAEASPHVISPLTYRQKETLETLAQSCYDSFVDKVAQGRHMSRRKVLEFAKGRVWTGEQAARRGLVDELGGFDLATKLACELAGISKEWDAGRVEWREMATRTAFSRMFARPDQDEREPAFAPAAYFTEAAADATADMVESLSPLWASALLALFSKLLSFEGQSPLSSGFGSFHPLPTNVLGLGSFMPTLGCTEQMYASADAKLSSIECEMWSFAQQASRAQSAPLILAQLEPGVVPD